MKRIKLLSSLMIVLYAIGFTSCTSEPVDPVFIDNWEENQPNPSGGSFQVTIDGEAFNATTATASFQQGILNISGAQGNAANASAVSLTVMGAATGTYTGQQANVMYLPNISEQSWYANFNINATPGENYNGSIIITEIDTQNHTVSGTFSCTAYWVNPAETMEPVTLANGTFTDVPYTGEVAPDPLPNEQYFTATVDGVEKDFTMVTTAPSGDFLQIAGVIPASSEVIQMMVKANITPGTYQWGSSEALTISYQTLSDGYIFDSGSLTITTNSGGYISGTYTFSGSNFDDEVIEVSGEFNVEL